MMPLVTRASLLIMLVLTTAAAPSGDGGGGEATAYAILPWGLLGLGVIWLLGMAGVNGRNEDTILREDNFPDAGRNESELAAFYEQAPISMMLLDGQQRVRRVNRAAVAAFGVGSADELIGLPVSKVLGCVATCRVTAEGSQNLRCRDCALHQAIRDALGQRTTQTQFSLKVSSIHGDKTRNAILQASISRATVNGEAVALVYLEDVTGRQRAEIRMREQAALLDIANDAITVLDLEGRILYWNHAAEKLYGWPVEEALGRSASQVFFESVPTEFIQALEGVLKHGEWSGKLSQTSRDRKPVVVQSRATLVRDAAYQAKSILFVNTDVTGKLMLEAKFLRAQRLETIGSLASGIAHDLNNVLAPISMAVELLRPQLREEQDQKFLQMMALSAQRGTDIVRQLLTFGRGVEATRARLKPQALIREIAKIIQETFPKSIHLRTALTEEVGEFIGDSTQIHQLILNLCVNARDAMPEGGTLTLSVRKVQLDQDAAGPNPDISAGPYLALTVADTGTGMTPEVREGIFTPFFTTKPVGKGTGLGLSTVRDIARNHGGFVEIWSAVGQGSRFTVYFPSLEARATDPTRPGAVPLPLGHGELVLIVDDEQSVLRLAKNILETHDYRVLTAGDGREALAVFARHATAIHAVIIDLMMPNLGGAAAIKELRAQNSSLPIIVVSGLPRDSVEASQCEGPGIIFLGKPFTVQCLMATLNDALASTRVALNHETTSNDHPAGSSIVRLAGLTGLALRPAFEKAQPPVLTETQPKLGS